MENEKDRFGETMTLVERAREDIYFAARDQELIEKLKARLQKIERPGAAHLRCPKCPGHLESYRFMGFALEQCPDCGGLWLDKGELQGILKQVARGPLVSWLKRLISPDSEPGGDAGSEKI